VRQLKKLFFLFAASFNSQFNQVEQYAVVAQLSPLGDALNLFREWGWEGYAPADTFCTRHGTIVHHNGAYRCICSNVQRETAVNSGVCIRD